jgi:hypothetical protein
VVNVQLRRITDERLKAQLERRVISRSDPARIAFDLRLSSGSMLRDCEVGDLLAGPAWKVELCWFSLRGI